MWRSLHIPAPKFRHAARGRAHARTLGWPGRIRSQRPPLKRASQSLNSSCCPAAQRGLREQRAGPCRARARQGGTGTRPPAPVCLPPGHSDNHQQCSQAAVVKQCPPENKDVAAPEDRAGRLDCPRTSPHARHMSRRASQVATSAAHCVGECSALGAGDDVGGNVARAQTAKVPRHQRRRAAGSRLDGSRPLSAGDRRRCCLRQLPSNGWVDDRFLV